MSRNPSRARRAAPALAAVLTCSLAVSGCSLLGLDAGSRTLDDFVSALSDGDVARAAGLTDDPDRATAGLTASVEGMQKAEISAHRSDDGADPDDGPTGLDITWTHPDGRVVTTHGEAETDGSRDDSRVRWTPAVLDTRLAEGGRLQYSELLDYATDVVDRTGAPLLSWTPVTSVRLAADAADSADRVAEVMQGAVPGLTGQQIRDGLQQSQPYEVAGLRQEDLDPIRADLQAVPGVTLSESGRLAPVDRDLRSPALDEIPDGWLQALRERAGWSATLQNPGADPVELGGAPAGDVPTMVSTLQTSIQRAALDTVRGIDGPASIVAIQPSTGGVLAVAQNSAADAQGPVALQGLFPPGSTFKTVTTAAALDAGTVGADDQVNCPGVVTVSGRTIPNEDEFALGTVPMSTAFARSCNTTQALISDALPPAAMKDTAASLGLGVDYTTPGLTTITGKVPETPPGPERVEAAIGQGDVLASPFGMAVMEASLAANGHMILPSVLSGRAATANTQPAPLPQPTVDTLRRFMVQTVQSGTATGAAGITGLGGKTGTAEVADGPAHGWFAGTTGDLSFAVLLEGADSSKPAVAAATRFLEAAGQPAPLATAPAGR